jgi:alkylation response protein AidB-like acyl-CoA dehydrogenase
MECEKLVESVARDVLGRHADSVDREARWPAEGVRALANSGLLGLTVPTALGGLGQGPRTFATATHTLAEHCASTAMIYLMHVCATQVIQAARTFGQRDGILRAIASGQHLSTLAFSEKGSRSHFWAPVSRAVDCGDTHLLTAEKSWVTSAGRADSYIISTLSAGASDPAASTLYYLDKNTACLSVAGAWDGLGLRGNASAPMKLDQVRVPLSARVSDEGQGFSTMIDIALPWFQLGSTAVALGIARAATEAVRQHLLGARLEHLGQPLASLGNLRARLAQMQIAVDTQQAFLGRVGDLLENPGPATMLAVLECKAAAGEMALYVTDLAMRACGGAAFSRHLTVERHFRDARACSVMAPTTDVLHDFVGKILLNMPLL